MTRVRAWILFILILAVYPLTFQRQLPLEHFSASSDFTGSSLNNYSLSFLQRWRERGILENGVRLTHPGHFSQIERGFPYSSYPPFYLLPAYLAVQAVPLQGEKEVKVLRILSALSHLVLVLLTAFSVLALSSSLIAAVSSALLGLFLPPLLLWQHNLWWPDFLGLTLTALLALLHVRSAARQEQSRRADLEFGFTVFVSCLVDWFPFLFVIALMMMLSGRRIFYSTVAMGAAFLLHVARVWREGSFEFLLGKFLLRSGTIVESVDRPNVFSHLASWIFGVGRWYMGWPMFFIFLLSLFAFLPRSSRFFCAGNTRKLLLPLFISLLAHWLLTNQHYPSHAYQSVRWAYFAALSPALFVGPVSWGWCVALLSWLAFFDSSFYARAYSAKSLSAELDACELIRANRKPGVAFLVEESVTELKRNYEEIYPLCRTFVTMLPPPQYGKSSRSFLSANLPGGIKEPPADVMVITKAGEKPTYLAARDIVASAKGWSLWRMNVEERLALGVNVLKAPMPRGDSRFRLDSRLVGSRDIWGAREFLGRSPFVKEFSRGDILLRVVVAERERQAAAAALAKRILREDPRAKMLSIPEPGPHELAVSFAMSTHDPDELNYLLFLEPLEKIRPKKTRYFQQRMSELGIGGTPSEFEADLTAWLEKKGEVFQYENFPAAKLVANCTDSAALTRLLCEVQVARDAAFIEGLAARLTSEPHAVIHLEPARLARVVRALSAGFTPP